MATSCSRTTPSICQTGYVGIDGTERPRPGRPGIPLKGDTHRPVYRFGDTVLRRAMWWTPAIHDLLRYVRARGFTFAPEPHGVEDGWEVLQYVEGQSGADSWAKVVPEEGLRRFARLLRLYHDAVSGYEAPPGAQWAFAEGGPIEGETFCHNDFGPWNVVWDGDEPIAVLDWDLVSPGPASDDVAYAAQYVVPFVDDDQCLRWLRYPAPPQRGRRLRIFAEAYGLASIDGLVSAVAARQRRTVVHVRHLAARGVRPQLDWVGSGSVDDEERRARWTEGHFGLFE